MDKKNNNQETIMQEIAKIKQIISTKDAEIKGLRGELEESQKRIENLKKKEEYRDGEIANLKEKIKRSIHNSSKILKSHAAHKPETPTIDSDKTMLSIHLNSTTYSSDKWESYFDHYQRKLEPYKLRADLRLLEIGVQNGGSLEVWDKFFEKKASIVGIDIESKIAFLDYPENTKTYVGDATDDEWLNIFKTKEEEFDILIDDGSHNSTDIIKTFSLLLERVRNGGLYVCEDLHTSYWDAYEGGLPNSKRDTAMQFFKELADYINREHWLEFCNYSPEEVTPVICEYFSRYPSLKDEVDKIVSIEFCNSLVFIIKQDANDANLGERIVSNGEAIVWPAALQFLP